MLRERYEETGVVEFRLYALTFIFICGLQFVDRWITSPMTNHRTPKSQNLVLSNRDVDPHLTHSSLGQPHLPSQTWLVHGDCRDDWLEV